MRDTDDLTTAEEDEIFSSLERYREMCVELPEGVVADQQWWLKRFRGNPTLVHAPGTRAPRRQQRTYLELSQVA